MEALMSMLRTDLLHLARTDQDELRSLMDSATIADPTLMPSKVPENDSNMMVTTTLGWQLDAQRQALQLTANQPNLTSNRPRANSSRLRTATQDRRAPSLLQNLRSIPENRTAQPAIDIPPPGQPDAVATSSSINARAHPSDQQRALEGDGPFQEDDHPRAKMTKVDFQTDFEVERFTFGSSSAIPQTLSKYPGKDLMASALAVDQMLGPAILSDYSAN